MSMRRRIGGLPETRRRLEAEFARHADFRGRCGVCGVAIVGTLAELQQGCSNGCETAGE